MTAAIVIKPGERPVGAELKGLASIQDLVGGWIEGIGVTLGEHYLTGYINEEGKLLNLRPNVVATMMWKHDVIAGTLVLVGPPDEEGEDTDVPDGALEEAIRMYEEARSGW